ncbi:MAG: hypothetical protein CVV56_08040 [Tenericutes bacterium HGW-Tenericutes-1]|jgi:phosphoribosyl-ATP pyrophosphohydrolase|nr:MAG: hypothetical protein CVV56_08040 [Tenericutes bacterium HGW-Tenericutes-1]PKM95795.1 MAG: hypothetical protein CVU84_03070 [Firmicutes bacterium HGW-Firmicutes-1]
MDHKNDSNENINTLTVSGTVMAKILNVTDRRVRQFAEEGLIDKAARGKYALISSVQKYIAFIKTNKDIEGSKVKELNYDDEHAIHEKVKREIAEITLAKIKGEVHEAQDVKHVMEHMLSNFRARLMNVPSKLAPILLARDNIPVIQSMIEKEVIEVLEELSEYNSEVFLSQDYIALEDEDEEEDEEIDSENEEEYENQENN